MATDSKPAAENARLKSELETCRMSIRQLESLLEGQNWMKEHAERARDEMRGKLENIAESLCPHMVNDLRHKHPDGMAVIEHETLADMIVADVKGQIDGLEESASGQRARDEDVESENVRLQREITSLKRSLEEEKASRERAEQELSDVRTSLDVASKAAKNTPDTVASRSVVENSERDQSLDHEAVPEWLSELQHKSTYEQGIQLLRIVAETGMARRQDVANAYGNALEIAPRSSAVNRAFSRLQEWELIELITVESETSGASTQHLIRLSERGRETCRLVLRLAPAPNEIERLLPRCETLSKVLLHLEAAEILRDAGYVVDLTPDPVEVPGRPGRHFIPDVGVTLGGEASFVVIEGKDGGGEDRERKWQDYYDAVGGSFYIVAASQKVMHRIKSDVAYWAKRNGYRLKLQMTNIGDARGKGRQGNDVWILGRNLGGDGG